MEFLAKLHTMEKEIKDEYTVSTKPDGDVLKAMKNYADIKQAHIRPVGDTIEEVNKKSKVDTALFQGDIILTKQQAEEIMEDINDKEGDRRKRQAYVDEKYPNTTWPNGVTFTFWNACTSLPFLFLQCAAAARRVFKKAVILWGWETCINFGESFSGEIDFKSENSVLLNNCPTNRFPAKAESDRILVLDSVGCWSHIGRIGGEQFLSLGPGCESVCQTIGFLKILFRVLLVLFVSANKCTEGSSAKCENGGFPHPRDCSKCSCPSGYGGKLCNERPYGCGKTLTATESYQTLNDTVGRWDYHPEGDNDDFYMCNYWIQGPPGSTIEVVLDDYTENLSLDGCVFAGVEIKTLADKRHTGYRFCSPKYAGTTLVSKHNIVPVITWSRVYQANTVLRYRIASSGSATSEPTPQPTPRPTPQPSSGRTPRPTRKPKKGCKDRFLCNMLKELGFCDSSEYKLKLKEKVCPGFCA
uniref:CUB domain-containing protein n=1 Tax=Angiostrongylus costaricensis TaxID=334426 RepID=A0A0R3PXN2_ANGCS